MNIKSMEEIMSRIKLIEFGEAFDLIVAIANGGIIPAALLNQRLSLKIELLRLNFRDSKQQPVYSNPRLMSEIDFEYRGKKILLVEDRVKTGATLNYAVSLLNEAELIKTFAVNGKADYSLYDEVCFRFPWIL